MLLRHYNIWILFIMLTGLSEYPVQAQVKFTAKISPTTIGKDETAELKLLVENANDVQQINPPALDNFIIVSGPNQESGMESINGNTTQYTGITFIIKPKSKGDFTIASTTASADGKVLKSNPVKIKVVNEPTGNSISSNSPFSGLMNFDEPAARRGNYNDYILKKGENITDKINKNIFIKVDASKTSCYVAEPIMVTYKLYTRLKSESNLTKNPSFNGFSVIDMLRQSDINALVEKYNGREYNVYSLRQTQLYPLQAGKVELEPASVENDIHFVKEEYLKRSREDDLFGDFSSIAIPPDALVNEKVTLQSKPVVINVKPLPEQGKPASFNGAVGKFSIQAVLEKNKLTTDDAGKLIITIEGEGNLTLVNAPEFEWPSGVEAFEPKMSESLDKRAVPVSGSKTFEYGFTVNKEGNYTLQPVEYSFFDPAAGQYKTVTTAPITFTVAKGSGKRTENHVGLQNKPAKENFFDTIFQNRWLLIAPLAMLILAGLFIWVRWDKKKGEVLIKENRQTAEIQALQEIKKPLSGAQALLTHDDSRQFYSMLDKELKIFLAEKLKLPAETMNRRNTSDALNKSGLATQDTEAILQLLDDISVQLYTPVSDESRTSYFYKKAEAVLHLFNV